MHHFLELFRHFWVYDCLPALCYNPNSLPYTWIGGAEWSTKLPCRMPILDSMQAVQSQHLAALWMLYVQQYAELAIDIGNS